MWLLWRPVSVYSHNRGRFHHLVFIFRGLLWLTVALFAWGNARDGWVWLAVALFGVVGLIFWRRFQTLEVINHILIAVDLVLIAVAIHLTGNLHSQAYILYGGEALFLTAYGTLRYSAIGILAEILSYGLATGAWDIRLFWWRNVILGLYYLGAGGLGVEYRLTRGRSRNNYLVLQQLSRLRVLQDSIVQEQDINVVLKQLLAEARETTHANLAYLVRVDKGQHIVTVITEGLSIPEDLDYTDAVAPENFTVISEADPAGWARVYPILRDQGMTSIALMPLRREDSLYGWIGLANDLAPATFAAQELIIRSLADMMLTQLKFYESQQIIIKRGNLLGILERVGRIVNRNLEMDQLLRSLKQAVADVLEIDVFFVALTLPDDPHHALMQYLWDEREEYPPEIFELEPDGLTAGVIASGEPSLLSGLKNKGNLTGSLKDPLGMIFVPLVHEGRVLGAMSAQSYRIEYDADHLEFLSAVASQAAIAIRNAQMYQQTQEIALTDYLTGMGNSRRFNMVLQSAIEYAEENQQPLALLLIDSDSLKSINDRFGHLAGDMHLQRLAQTICDNVREGDMPFRYAGDEFVIVLPKTDMDDAAQIGERIRYAIEGHQLEWSAPPIIGSTISVGAATFQPGMSADELFQAADRAMYQAKQSGKNRVSQA